MIPVHRYVMAVLFVVLGFAIAIYYASLAS